MRITPKWLEWAAKMTAVRLTQMIQHLDDQLVMFGVLDEVDAFMFKILKQEQEKRYGEK